MKLAVVLLSIVLATTARAEEIRIGHLETNDDSGLNWLQFHCTKEDLKMQCDIFQTLLFHKKVDPAFVGMTSSDAVVEDFKKTFAPNCKPILDAAPKMEANMKKGVDLRGRPLDMRIVGPGLEMTSRFIKACRDQTVRPIQDLYSHLVEQDRQTCIAHNDYSSSTFSWNAAADAWSYQTSAAGPCGMIYIGTLKQEKANHFWNYTEQHITTNPEGSMANGMSCKALPGLTLNYTWKKSATAENCGIIESDQY